MNSLEQELRDRTNVDDLMNKKIQNVPQGNALVNACKQRRAELFREMCDNEFDNVTTQAYNNVRYDLHTAIKRIGSQQAKMVRAKIALRG